MKTIAVTACLLGVTVASCRAIQDRDPELTAGWGVVGVLDEQRVDGFSLEYRHRTVGWNLAPMVGYSRAAGEGASYAFGGLHYPIDLGSRWRLSPSLAAGYFDSKGGLALGGELEFRSGLELNYLLSEEWRVGLSFTHLSNAGLFDFNPGTEAVICSLHYLF